MGVGLNQLVVLQFMTPLEAIDMGAAMAHHQPGSAATAMGATLQ